MHAFLRPKKTFEEIVIHQSTLFSFATTVMVAVIWIVRDVVFYFLDFLPARESLVPFFSNMLNPTLKVTVRIPCLLLTWIIVSFLVSHAASRLGGRGSFSEMASVVGFVFWPTLIAVFADLIEFALFESAIRTSEALFFVFGLLIPFILWPTILLVLAIRTAECISTPRAILVSMIFVPVIIPFVFNVF